MDLAEIRARVKAESDARFGETIEKMLLILRYQHTHQCWRKECWCEYCQFINGTYVAHKLNLHQMKKRLNWYEYHTLNWDHAVDLMSLESNMWAQRQRIATLKQHKKELQKEVL